MRFKTLLVLMVLLLAVACTQEPSTLVSDAGTAPFYTSLVDAQAAATEGQLIAVEFYTDW